MLTVRQNIPSKGGKGRKDLDVPLIQLMKHGLEKIKHIALQVII